MIHSITLGDVLALMLQDQILLALPCYNLLPITLYVLFLLHYSYQIVCSLVTRQVMDRQCSKP